MVSKYPLRVLNCYDAAISLDMNLLVYNSIVREYKIVAENTRW